MSFRFEESGKRRKRDDVTEPTEDRVTAEFQALSRFRSDGAGGGHSVVARFIATIKEVLSSSTDEGAVRHHNDARHHRVDREKPHQGGPRHAQTDTPVGK